MKTEQSLILSTKSNFEVLFEHIRPRVPLVSVIVSLYNYQHFIEECLNSVKEQTLPHIDLIVVDDCSKDDSIVVVKKWMQKNSHRFERCSLFRHNHNSGLAQTRNTAFAQARTPYVFVLDADNVLYPRCLERHLQVLSQCDASFAYSYLEVFGARRGLQNTVKWEKEILQYGNMVDAMVLLRKSAWEQAGGYSVMEVMGWEDYDLWFKIGRNGGWGILIPEILARYRVHSKSVLRTITNPKSDRLREILLDSYPEYFTDHRIRMDILTKAKRWDEAISACQAALMEEDEPYLWDHLLWLYLQANKQNELNETAIQILRRHPERATDLVNRLDPKLVKEVLYQFLQTQSPTPGIYFALARAHLVEGEIEKCLYNAKIARDLAEKRRFTIEQLLDDGKLNEAQQIIELWHREDPENVEILFYKALLEMRQQRVYSALAKFDQLIKCGYKSCQVLENYIDAALQANKKGIALKLLQDMILLEPDQSWIDAMSRLASKHPSVMIFNALYKSTQPDSVRQEKYASETLKLLLDSPDIVEAFQKYSNRFDDYLVKYIRKKAQEESNQTDPKIGEALSELADYIEQWINQG